MDRIVINSIVSFLLCFCSIVVYFSSNSYAIEGKEFLLIYGLSVVQDQHYTLWESNYPGFATYIMLPSFLMAEQNLYSSEFGTDIELESSFSDLGNGSFLFLNPYQNNTLLNDWNRIDWDNAEGDAFPLSFEVIDQEERILKVIFGDKNNSTASFIVSPSGIYDLEGTLKDSIVDVDWGDERFKIAVSENGETLKVTIKPSEVDLSPMIRYSKGFSLGGFVGEIEFCFVNGKPYLEVEFENKEEERAAIDIDFNGVCLDLDFKALATDAGFVSINVSSLSLEDERTRGGIEVTAEEEGQTVVLSLGANYYFEINKNGSMREIIDEFFTELAQEMHKMLPGWAQEDEDIDPDMTVDDIKEMLWEATGDDLKEFAKLIEDINEQRQGLVIPSNFRFFMDFTSQRDQREVRVVFPLIENQLAFKTNFGLNQQEMSFVFPFNNETVELGYGNDLGIGMAVFKLADLSNISSAELGISNEGIQYVEWLLGGLEGTIDASGFVIESSDKSLLGLSALDVLLQGLESERSELAWSFRYNFEGGYNLRLDVPLDEFGYKGARISWGLNSGKLSFLIRMPLWGGVLRVNSQGIVKYEVKSTGIDLIFGFENGILNLEFEITRDSDNAEDEENEN
ncbi:MAG: hypothetical protein P9M06_05705 [Candidatus Saelkia tenebricola]|nr:hypothetical protein [Candidatus Saelkia tenebricola]